MPKAMEYSLLFPSVRFRSPVVSIFFACTQTESLLRPAGTGNATGLSFKPQDGSAPAALKRIFEIHGLHLFSFSPRQRLLSL